jgi:hypothetical protein
MSFSREGNMTNSGASKTLAFPKIQPSLPRSRDILPADLKTLSSVVNWKKQPDKIKEIDSLNGKRRLSYFLSFCLFSALLNGGVDGKSGGVFGCRRQ